MSVLQSLTNPADVRALDARSCVLLAQEIREHLITSVSAQGGHLGPNLGVVELTIALHRVFDSPSEPIIFDTGHQSYVHKLLTGRTDFSHLREAKGLSGYPSRSESIHDFVENSHASTSLSWAYGIDRARPADHRWDRVVAVIGDGALTGGMSWEAINMIAADEDCRVVIVVNDNERSYAPTIGGLAKHLSALRTTEGYEWTLSTIKKQFNQLGPGGRLALDAMHGIKKGIKDLIAPQTLFEDIGLKYIGPIDGHDIDELEFALRRAKHYMGPVLVHAITQKGHGYEPAINHKDDQMHAVGPIHPDTGLPIKESSLSWTELFREYITDIAREDERVVGITAAMTIPVGLDKLAKVFPERVIDVGIAEQHAVTMAAGMASQGRHPFVAVYATFLNRAFDQVLMDVGLHHEGVTFILDRAGVTGPDGASHHGMWDISLLHLVPGIHLGAPRDAEQLKLLLAESLDISHAPSVIRLPKAPVMSRIPAVDTVGRSDVVFMAGDEQDILLIAQGPMVPVAMEAAKVLETYGCACTVVDPRWYAPIDDALVPFAGRFALVVTLEDGLVQGGMGQTFAYRLSRDIPDAFALALGLPTTYISHDSRDAILREFMIDTDGVVLRIQQECSKIAALPSSSGRNVGKIQSISTRLEAAVIREEQR